MTFTPHISIYTEGKLDPKWFEDSLLRATLVFSKNLDYNKKLSRTRINIHLGDEDKLYTNSSIKSIWVKTNIDTSKKISYSQKISILLKIIYESLTTIASIEGWDTEPFERALKLSLNDNGYFVWHSAFKLNKSRNLKARISIQVDKNGKVPILAEFFDTKTKQQFQIPIIDTFLHFVTWEKTFLKPVWIDNEKFGFSFNNSQLKIYADWKSRKSVTIISEKNWSREEIEGQLRRLTFRQFADNKEYIEWANK